MLRKSAEPLGRALPTDPFQAMKSPSTFSAATVCLVAFVLLVECPGGAHASTRVGEPCSARGCHSRAMVESFDKALLAEWEPLGFQFLAKVSEALGAEHARAHGFQGSKQAPEDTSPPLKTPAWHVSRLKDRPAVRILEVELPGVAEDSVSLEVTTDKQHQRTLSLSAFRPGHGVEYQQQWRLSSEVQAEKLEASMADGLLRITLPDKPTPPAMRIAVEARAGEDLGAAGAHRGGDTPIAMTQSRDSTECNSDAAHFAVHGRGATGDEDTRERAAAQQEQELSDKYKDDGDLDVIREAMRLMHPAQQQ